MIDTDKIKTAAETIASRQVALNWLQEHGVKLTGKVDAPEATVKIVPHFSHVEKGGPEASALLRNYAIIRLPEIVQDAIRCCKNDIEIARSQIIEQLEERA